MQIIMHAPATYSIATYIDIIILIALIVWYAYNL